MLLKTCENTTLFFLKPFKFAKKFTLVLKVFAIWDACELL